MDEEIEALVVSVRADTSGFARDVAAMQGSLTEGLGGAGARAGGMIESALARSIRSTLANRAALRGRKKF